MAQSSVYSRFIPQSWLARILVCCAAVALALIAYGVSLIPSTSPLSVAAAVAVLVAYASAGVILVPAIQKRNSILLRTATWAGLTAAMVFAVEVSLEYVVLPRDNAPWGMVEFGLVFFIYLCTGALLTLKRQDIQEAALGAVLASVLSSVVWCVFILATFLLFYQTPRQERVFRAEGNYDDFAHSGTRDFSAFIMEDFLGATFFHLLLGPLFASLLGFVGGWIGRGCLAIRQTKRP